MNLLLEELRVENLLFSLNATTPVFMMMILGLVFYKLKWIDDAFASSMNKFVFKVFLPVMVFEDIAVADFADSWDTGFVLFCLLATIFGITFVILLSLLLKDKTVQGEFIQVSYRSSAALLGLAFVQNMYGNSGMVPLMLMACVPLYNICAVLILSFFRPERRHMNKEDYKKLLKDVLTNPILIGLALGFAWSIFRLPTPAIMMKVVKNLGSCATPMGLIAMGATFDFKKALNTGMAAVSAACIKLVVLVACVLPFAIGMGFREQNLVAIVVMMGSASTVSCYVMAKNMGHEGVLTSSTVMLTTLFSAFTLTFWLFLLRSMGLI